MPDLAALFGANKSASTVFVLFVPSHDRAKVVIDQNYWVREALAVLGRLFGGATAYPRGTGVWRDDAQAGQLLFDEPVVIQCYTSRTAIEASAAELRAFLTRLGTEANQGAIGFVIDQEYFEIGFPVAGAES